MKLWSVGSLSEDLVVSHFKGMNSPIWVDLHSREIVDAEENTEVVAGGKNIDIGCSSKHVFYLHIFAENNTKTAL